MTRKLLFLLAVLPSVLFAQHKLKGKFSPAEQFKFAFLYKVTPDLSLFVNNAELKADGSFEIELDSTVAPGVYRIVYAQPQDEYNFDFIYNGKEDVSFEFSLEADVTYTESSENKLYASYTKSITLINESIRNYYSKQVKDEVGFRKIFDILRKAQTQFEAAAEGMYVKAFITASRPYIPESYEDVNSFSNNVKAYYFEPIDFGNKTLQNSNYLIKNSLGFVFNFIDRSKENESYIANIISLEKAIGDNTAIKKTLLKILWDQFSDEENEAVANYISEDHLFELAQQANDSALVEKMSAFKNASVGSSAPDFKIELKTKAGKIQKKKLSDLKQAKNYVVFFWSTTCSHCLDEIPLLKTFIETYDSSQVQVIAIALDNELYRWKEMTFDYPDFIHVYGEGKWDNAIGNSYNVTATPSYFVLDTNKKIIGKPYDLSDFEAFFKGIAKPKTAESEDKKNTKDISEDED